MTTVADRILAVLCSSPYGLTATEIADRIGTTPGNISSRLSKLVAYGTIKRTQGKIAPNSPLCAIYKAPPIASETANSTKRVGLVS